MWSMVPGAPHGDGLFTTGVGSERTLNSAARSTDGGFAIVCLGSQRTVFIHLDKIAAREDAVRKLEAT